MHILKCWLLIFHENDWKKRSKVVAVINVFNKHYRPVQAFPYLQFFHAGRKKMKKSTFNL